MPIASTNQERFLSYAVLDTTAKQQAELKGLFSRAAWTSGKISLKTTSVPTSICKRYHQKLFESHEHIIDLTLVSSK